MVMPEFVSAESGCLSERINVKLRHILNPVWRPLSVVMAPTAVPLSMLC